MQIIDSRCVDELKFNPNGLIVQMNMTKEGVAPIATLNPYEIIQAETICWSEGIKSEPNRQGGMCVYPTGSNAYIEVKGVDFGANAKSFAASVTSASEGGKIQHRLDSPTGRQVGVIAVPNTMGGVQQWENTSCAVKDASGLHDLYLAFTDYESHEFKVGWRKFE